MKIKICGLKHPDNIKTITGLQPDYMGFICYAPSPRFIATIQPETLAEIPHAILKTAVFVNEGIEKIQSAIATYQFDAVQLHGNEDADFCKLLKGNVQVIKAFGVGEAFDFEQLGEYVDSVDYFLFDTKTDKHGGSGQAFNWQVLDNYKLDIPFFLSGGLSLENLATVKTIKHPQLYGVDINSRFEIEPGLKDINKLKQAFDILK